MTLDELKALAHSWAANCKPAPHTLALYGEMGAGKTTFSQFAIDALMQQPCEVVSPTFPIIQVYQTPKGDVWHADLYRLNTLQEVEETGLLEAMHQHICIIEWPQLIEPVLKNIPYQKIIITR